MLPGKPAQIKRRKRATSNWTSSPILTQVDAWLSVILTASLLLIFSFSTQRISACRKEKFTLLPVAVRQQSKQRLGGGGVVSKECWLKARHSVSFFSKGQSHNILYATNNNYTVTELRLIFKVNNNYFAV